MSLGFLELLDSLLISGAQVWQAKFSARQITYLEKFQNPDGGFSGRLGFSDLYYTDFALRILILLAPNHIAIEEVARYLTRLSVVPNQVIDCFNMLNIARLLRQSDFSLALPTAPIIACLERFHLANGGYAHLHQQEISAYQTFLAALCYEMLDIPISDQEQIYEKIATLRCADGGYGETLASGFGQANATAAVIALLLKGNVLSETEQTLLATFYCHLQSRDGGMRAHNAIEAGDLLSTFTSLTALAGINRLADLDLAAVGHFVRALALPGGGFRSCLDENDSDIEYTYYGLGTFALLQAYLAAQK